MQPTYIPWIGYFDLMDQSDIFIFYDNVKITRSYWDVRNKIREKNGSIFLSVPIKRNLPSKDLTFVNAKINYDVPWINKHLKSIKQNYQKSKHFDELYTIFSKIINEKKQYLADININLIEIFRKKMGIDTIVRKTSQMDSFCGAKDEKLVNICKSIKADKYLSPIGAAPYIEKTNPGGNFSLNNIKLFYHNYLHPQYEQQYKPFISHLSIIDLLFNYGFNDSLEVLRSGRSNSISYKDIKGYL